MEATESARSPDVQVQDFDAGELKIRASQAPKVVRLDWTGRSNARDPWSVMRHYFEELAEALAESDAKLEMHFEEIEYFNSSTITAVIRIMQLLQGREVPIRISFDAGVRWQKLSFDGLKIFEQSNKLLEIAEA